uniref:Uncharacterized protein n=1 Tax=Myotis myotis TaxID=51298 RepID=A0A7J7V3X6_MYOMY|nr:hypothetical protein mMyoMyo1_008425 [Myotis myotis]
MATPLLPKLCLDLCQEVLDILLMLWNTRNPSIHLCWFISVCLKNGYRLSGYNISPHTKRLQVRFPIKSMYLGYRLDPQPQSGSCGRQPIQVSLSHPRFSLSLPPPFLPDYPLSLRSNGEDILGECGEWLQRLDRFKPGTNERA